MEQRGHRQLEDRSPRAGFTIVVILMRSAAISLTDGSAGRDLALVADPRYFR
jgi:hypothetical protein